MAAPPPSYDSQKYNPGQGVQGPPGNYSLQPVQPGNYLQQPGAPTVNRGPMGMFGKDPLTTICPNCQANVRNCI